MSRTKVNPRRRPATAADVARAKEAATREATIFLSVLRDKKDMPTEELQDIWAAVGRALRQSGAGLLQPVRPPGYPGPGGWHLYQVGRGTTCLRIVN